jgi:UDP-glucuronate 4-epimerase
MTPPSQRILVTGCAGFIGYHLGEKLLAEGREVVGLDNLNDYYDPALKQARLERLRRHAGFSFQRLDLADQPAMAELFASHAFTTVIHLAAQAGVRYSLTHPHVYAQSNLVGFLNVLEGCRQRQVGHLVYASTSSVYGLNRTLPFSERQGVDHPMTLYAATKRANELMAHSYSHLFGLPTTGLRFFTVYGPWGRPDMALFKFTKAILAGEPIEVFNHGKMARDFTYVGDIVEGLARVAQLPPRPNEAWTEDADPSSSSAPFRVLNLGNSQPVELMAYIRAAEQALGRSATIDLKPMQPGDVPASHADCTAFERLTGFRPATPIATGVARFVAWYRDYYRC